MYVLDPLGDVDGLTVINGVAWETDVTTQTQQDTQKQVCLSGDGTVSAVLSLAVLTLAVLPFAVLSL